MPEFIVICLVSVVFYLLFRQAFVFRSMIDHLKGRVHEPVDLEQLNDIRNDAVTYGLEEEFNRYIEAIIKANGREGVKNGHVLWVIEQLDKDIPYCEGMSIPGFS